MKSVEVVTNISGMYEPKTMHKREAMRSSLLIIEFLMLLNYIKR